jgi:hypothetical protein
MKIKDQERRTKAQPAAKKQLNEKNFIFSRLNFKDA